MLNCGRVSRNDMVGSTNLPRRPAPYCFGDYPAANDLSIPLPNALRHSEDVEARTACSVLDQPCDYSGDRSLRIAGGL